MIIKIRPIEVTVLLLLLTALWSPSIDGSGALEYVRYAGFGSFSAATLVLAYFETARRQVTLHLTSGAMLLLLLFVFTAFSAFWSEGWPSSGLKAVLVVLALSASLAAASVMTNAELVKIIALACSIFVVVGFFVSLLIPSIGVETGWLLAGKWRGISGQKNGFGILAAISLVSVATLLWGKPTASGARARLVPGLLIVFFGTCLILSGSRGAQMACLVGLGAAGFLRLRHDMQTLTLVGSAIVIIPVAIAAVMSFHADATELGVLGLSIDTSSRTAIWSFGFENLPGRELLGFGVSGFWTPERLTIFENNHGWVLDNFHNGYVTVLIEGGFIGISLLLAGLVTTFNQMRRQAHPADRAMLFSFAYLAMIIAENLVENILGRSTSFMFIVFLMIIFSACGEQRLRYSAPVRDAVAVN